MSTSARSFDRWIPHDETTWSFQVFSRYDDQLGMLGTAHANAMKYTYGALKRQGATWSDDVGVALGTGDRFLNAFSDLKHWSEYYNLFDNWANLSRVLTCCANLETYISGAVELAIRSNPGILFGAPRSIDGAALLKRGGGALDTAPHVTACTKGDWSQRLSALGKLFGPLPTAILDHHAELEDLRTTRNRFGHAFGRDIDEVRDHGARIFRPMERLSRERAHGFEALCRSVARALDRHLLVDTIGDFDAIRFLAKHHADIPEGTLGDRAVALKRAIGQIGAQPRGKLYCRGLITYWDEL